MQFERSDWVLFRSLDTLGQRAGVPRDRIGAIVAKELVDNALDAGAKVMFGGLGTTGAFYVQDDGPGLPGNDQEVADFFSISRPLRSSKLLRLPTRGALGNGLRVVAGAVLASSGKLRVRTGGRWLTLEPQFHTGKTLVTREETDGSGFLGTRVEVTLGSSLRVDFTLAELAQQMRGNKEYKGLTSPHWYSSGAFRELMSAAPPEAPLGDLLVKFDGGKKVDVSKATEGGRSAKTKIGILQDIEITGIFSALRAGVKAPEPRRLGFIGKDAGPHEAYGKAVGFYKHGDTQLPCVVEVWAVKTDTYGDVRMMVNRTPVVSQVRHRAGKDGTKPKGVLSGCGLNHWVETGKAVCDAVINVQTPYMAVTNDGKEPNLEPIFDLIKPAFEQAVRAAKRLDPEKRAARLRGEKPESKKDLIERHLDAAIDRVSGSGAHRWSLRRLYYAMRSPTMVGTTLEYGYFCRVIGDIENARGGDLPGIYRDDRGALHHPHTGEVINLGTRAVEGYKRPKLYFNKILYIEKGGPIPLLKDAQWMERWDCAVLTSQGQASRAAKDVLDLLGDTDEEITFYCIHDSDGYGTLIYEKLQEASRARPARRVKIINLGLEPSEGRRMGLEVESFDRKKEKVPVADYVGAADRDWLQTHRIELDAMTSPQFLRWLDQKMAQHGESPKKVIPTNYVIQQEAEARAAAAARRRIVAEILARANIDELVAGEMAVLRPHLRSIDADSVGCRLDGPASWRGIVGEMVNEVASAPPASVFSTSEE